ncbi:hypothetical protein IVB40_34995 [Bradyrhizobium sp. 40]|uniref:hypothetical protein n=1 Tax=Bradyrhizobium sp. 40 TaxID=2782674 RepID=UPI001FFF209F|nr:hypothetical protein [Bradyrhizobium sp. 40]UPJ42410.1 hypothetical protein IVB40_34995 [Bradyrhizobium sp. 40]
MNAPSLEADALWLAGTMDHFGQVGIKNNTIFVRLKSTLLNRLEVISSILGIDRKPHGPFDNGAFSKKLQYELVLVGKELALLENLVTSRMKVRPQMFQEKRDQLRDQRRKHGLSGKHIVARLEVL